LANYWLKNVLISKDIPFSLLPTVSLSVIRFTSFNHIIIMFIAAVFKFGLETHHFSKHFLAFTYKRNGIGGYIFWLLYI
jgi:hypothetical protein